MTRILFVGQDKGGVGKSLMTRALAAAIPSAPIFEIDSTRRLLELEHRSSFFPMRAERSEIERTGGRAARSEFDAVINAIATASESTIVDIGANTGRSLLSVLADLAPDIAQTGIEMGLLVIVTNEPGALSEAPVLLTTAKSFSTSFVLENRLHGPVDQETLASIAGKRPISVMPEFVLEDQAQQILQGAGLEAAEMVDPKKLIELHGVALGARIRRDLAALRLGAMQAVRKPAEWLVGGA